MNTLGSAVGFILNPIGTLNTWLHKIGVTLGWIPDPAKEAKEPPVPYVESPRGIDYSQWITPEMPSIPVQGGRQEGGFVSHGIYELGEGGQTEAVIPLTKWEKSISKQNALLGIIHDELVIQSFYNRELVRAKEWDRVFG